MTDHEAFRAALDAALAEPVRGDGSSCDADNILLLALKNAGVGVWEHDLIAGTVWLSREARGIFGLGEDHPGILVRDEWLDLIDARDCAEIECLARRLDSSESNRLLEFRVRDRLGETRWLRISACVVSDRDGHIVKLAGVVSDDTDRRRAEEQVRESEAQLRLVQEAALIGTFVSEFGNSVLGSAQFYRNLGLPEDTKSIERDAQLALIHPDDRQRVEQESRSALLSKTADSIDTNYRIFRADTGELRWIFSRIKFERDAEGRPVRMLGAHLDITESNRAREALEDSVALNQSLIDASVDCVKLIELDGRLAFINDKGLAALEIEDGSTVLCDEWAKLIPVAERHKVDEALEKARNGQVGHFNAFCPTATGKEKWWDVVVSPVLDARGQIKNLLAISRDITGHLENLAQIRWTASHDMLTGLPNRRYFQEHLETVLARAAGDGSRVGLMQLDLDDFKQINDALGHDAGDALLKEFAERLQAATRHDETVVRLGGDEFAIVVPDLSESRSLSDVVEEIHRELARPFVHQGRVFDCRASIGKAIYPEHGITLDELLKSADIALYVAKTDGRGRVRRFESAMRSRLQERAEMVRQARAALNEGRIFPFYQPKIRFPSGAPAGFEALLRWRDRDGRVRLPGEIAAAFEDLDVAASLSERIQLQVLADVRRWLDQGIDVGHVAINASAAEFRQDDFSEALLSRMKAAGVPANAIELEVTETVFLGRGAEYVERALARLSAHGVRIALDDFGTGYASLSHLKQFPVDIIKIDQSFVRNLEIDPDDSAIVEALVGLGKSLSIGIVAEGIEGHAQAHFLARLGCDYGQGFLFSEAVAAAEVPDLVARLKQARFTGGGALKRDHA